MLESVIVQMLTLALCHVTSNINVVHVHLKFSSMKLRMDAVWFSFHYNFWHQSWNCTSPWTSKMLNISNV